MLFSDDGQSAGTGWLAMALSVWENTRRFITIRNEAIIDVWVVLGQLKSLLKPHKSIYRAWFPSVTAEKRAFMTRMWVHPENGAGSYYSRSENRMQWIQSVSHCTFECFKGFNWFLNCRNQDIRILDLLGQPPCCFPSIWNTKYNSFLCLVLT